MRTPLTNLINKDSDLEYYTFEIKQVPNYNSDDEKKYHYVIKSTKPLIDEQKQKLFHFCEMIETKAIPVYRGINRAILANRYYVCDYQDKNRIAKEFFMVGDKAQYFFKEELGKYFGDYPKDSLIDIWHDINYILSLEDINISDNNREFVNFFKDYNNEQKLNELVKNLNLSNDERIKVIDYYCSFLSTINNGNCNQQTTNRNVYFLSTSQNYDVANKYLEKKKENNKINNNYERKPYNYWELDQRTNEEREYEGIIFYGWVPQSDKSVKYFDINQPNSFIKELGLPFYLEGIYKEDEEISIKCALMAHYIIGFQYVTNNQNTKEFYINPWLFETDLNKDYPNDGLYIDQSNFIETCKEFLVERVFHKDSDGNYWKGEECPDPFDE